MVTPARDSFFVPGDVLQRSEYAGFDQGNLIRNQAGGGVHSADSSLDVVQAADGCGEQAAGLFLVHGISAKRLINSNRSCSPCPSS